MEDWRGDCVDGQRRADAEALGRAAAALQALLAKWAKGGHWGGGGGGDGGHGQGGGRGHGDGHPHISSAPGGGGGGGGGGLPRLEPVDPSNPPPANPLVLPTSFGPGPLAATGAHAGAARHGSIHGSLHGAVNPSSPGSLGSLASLASLGGGGEATELVEVGVAEEACRTGHLDWVREQLTGEGGRNLFHIKKETGVVVNLKKSSLGLGAASLHFVLRAKSTSVLAAGLLLVNDLVRTVEANYARLPDVAR